MSLKQNVDYIKEEINNDEKMLEGLIRFEGWFKRYKIPLVIIVAFLVILGVGYNINQYYQEQLKEKNASLYQKALLGDEVAIADLKDSKSLLYDLYLYQKALKENNATILKELESSKDPMIAKLSKQQNMSLNQDLKELNSKDSNEVGYLEAAFLEIKKGNTKEAKAILAKIPSDSAIKEIANSLEHLTIKGINYAK
ncbi:hypothetical protein [Helicobacter canadensis]|nr:hypothetical protein [Helicobacter canadensis]STO99317.1 50S ribosomal protein L22 [Helicobacter canadensis]